MKFLVILIQFHRKEDIVDKLPVYLCRRKELTSVLTDVELREGEVRRLKGFLKEENVMFARCCNFQRSFYMIWSPNLLHLAPMNIFCCSRGLIT